jgi:hypothetical protein
METILSILLAVVTLSLVAALFYYGTQDPVVELSDESIKIKGGVFYSVKFEFKDLAAIDTIPILPKIILRTNGFSTIRSLRGHFLAKEIGRVILFVDRKSSPFIYFELNSGKKIYLNFKNPEDTIDYYNAIKNKMSWKSF